MKKIILLWLALIILYVNGYSQNGPGTITDMQLTVSVQGSFPQNNIIYGSVVLSFEISGKKILELVINGRSYFFDILSGGTYTNIPFNDFLLPPGSSNFVVVAKLWTGSKPNKGNVCSTVSGSEPVPQ
jgi:hypothetical protein